MKFKAINQKGFSPIIIVAALVAVLVIGGGAYYFFSKQNDKDASLSSSPESKAAESACLEYVNDADFCKFTSNWSMEGSVTTTITSPNEGSVITVRSNGENSHTTIKNPDGITSEVIILDKTTYMKDMSAESWTKFSSEPNSSTETPSDDYTPDFSFEDQKTKDTTTVKSLGKEACGESTCFKYQIIDSSTPDTETLIWFDDNDYKARRLTTKNTEGVSELTFSYEAVAITEPSPVVDAPNYENMSAEEIQQQLQSLPQ